jgi:hypothetical protein
MFFVTVCNMECQPISKQGLPSIMIQGPLADSLKECSTCPAALGKNPPGHKGIKTHLVSLGLPLPASHGGFLFPLAPSARLVDGVMCPMLRRLSRREIDQILTTVVKNWLKMDIKRSRLKDGYRHKSMI